MKLSNKIALLLAILITASGIVSASPASLHLFPDSSSTRIDSFTSYELTVENTGPVKDVYTLSSTSSQEVTIAPGKVELEPGNEETVNVWFNPRTDRDAGTHTFELTAESRATGSTFSTTGTVEIIKDHEVDIDVQRSKVACLGEKAVYTAEITNTGIQPEEFSISSDFGKLSRNKVNLEDGETAEVTLEMSSESPVERNFDLVAASTTSYAQDIQNLQFNAEECWNSEVEVTPQTQDVAAFTNAEFDITVRNLGTRTDTFTLTASQGELTSTELEVSAGDTETATLTVTPEQLGQQNIEITSKGNSQASEQVSFNAYNGMGSDVSFEQESRNICENGGTSYDVNVENTGEAEETFALQTSYGELEDTEVELEAGESAEVDLDVNSSAGTGKQEVEVVSTSSTFGEPVTSASAELEIENCWDLEMNVVPEVKSAGENRSTLYRINLENTGARENTYQLSHEGPEWIEIKPEEVTVGAGETETAYMYAGIPFKKKGEVEITAIAVGNQVEKSETVRLLVGEDIEDAIKDDSNRVSGSFLDRAGGTISRAVEGENAYNLLVSILVAAVVTLGLIYRS